MQNWSSERRAEGKRIAFVPTMGALHEGHLSLMREGKKRADALVVSIYVNPAQFAPTEDLAKYPRDDSGDFDKCEDLGVDAVFFPTNEIMYPDGYQTYVTVEQLSRLLCGISRPTHFSGVTTVCLKLFNMVKPHLAVFGEKDYQQLTIIRRMVKDLNLELEVEGLPIVREADGLAMSSRNRYLDSEQREAALSLSRSLGVAQDMVSKGEQDVENIREAVKRTVESTEIPVVDYIEIVDPQTLERTSRFPARLLVAANVGPARLIDNCELR